MKDPLGQKTILRLEPVPVVSKDVDKGKGIIFNFEIPRQSNFGMVQKDKKLLAKAIKSGLAMSRLPSHSETQSEGVSANFEVMNGYFQIGSTVPKTGALKASSSGSNLKRNYT